jgi:hypothetical protein
MNYLPGAVVDDLIALGSLEDGPSATRNQLLARLKPFQLLLGQAQAVEIPPTDS